MTRQKFQPAPPMPLTCCEVKVRNLKEVLLDDVGELDIRIETEKKLKEVGIHEIHQLVETNRTKLRRMSRYFGMRPCDDIESALQKIGLALDRAFTDQLREYLGLPPADHAPSEEQWEGTFVRQWMEHLHQAVMMLRTACEAVSTKFNDIDAVRTALDDLQRQIPP